MGFEPTRAEHNGLAVHRLNHSATSSYMLYKNKNSIVFWKIKKDSLRIVIRRENSNYRLQKILINILCCQ